MERPMRTAAVVAIRHICDLQNPSDSDSDTNSTITDERDSVIADSESESSDEHQPDDVPQAQNQLVSRNGEVWSREPQVSQAQPRLWNILRESRGPTRQALQNGCGESPAHAFKIFVTSEIVEIVVRYTNDEARRNDANWRDTNREEIYVFVGLLILAGVYHGNNESIIQLWSESDGRPIFGKSMPRNRFTSLLKYIRFDDRTTREVRRVNDKLAPIRQVTEMFATKFRSSYKPGEGVTVDEQLLTFKGRCPFKVYLPNKPGKYGIKLWIVADSNSKYCCNLQVYTGKSGNKREIGQGARVVLELTDYISNTGRHVTADNFFSSVLLARSLLGRNLTYSGTIRKNKPEIPQPFQAESNRPVSSSIFGFQENLTLVSYVPKKNKSVILLSSLHQDKKCDEEEPFKPEIILHYNRNKSGVDTLDQMLRGYTCKRKSRRWPFTLFCNLLDIAAFNAFVLFTTIHPQFANNFSHKRRRFLIDMAKQLLPVGAFPPVQPIKVLEQPGASSLQTRRRCHVCPAHIDRKSKLRCVRCEKTVCKEHGGHFCMGCV